MYAGNEKALSNRRGGHFLYTNRKGDFANLSKGVAQQEENCFVGANSLKGTGGARS